MFMLIKSRRIRCAQNCSWSTSGRRSHGRPRVDVTIILEWILDQWGVKCCPLWMQDKFWGYDIQWLPWPDEQVLPLWGNFVAWNWCGEILVHYLLEYMFLAHDWSLNKNLTCDSQYLDSNKLPPKHELYITKQSEIFLRNITLIPITECFHFHDWCLLFHLIT